MEYLSGFRQSWVSSHGAFIVSSQGTLTLIGSMKYYTHCNWPLSSWKRVFLQKLWTITKLHTWWWQGPIPSTQKIVREKGPIISLDCDPSDQPFLLRRKQSRSRYGVGRAKFVSSPFLSGTLFVLDLGLGYDGPISFCYNSTGSRFERNPWSVLGGLLCGLHLSDISVWPFFSEIPSSL